MFVCSKRAFLNIMTQMCTREQLLLANYYIMDGNSMSNNLYISDGISTIINEYGETEYATTSSQVSNAVFKEFNIYNKEDSSLDPSCLSSIVASGNVDMARQKFIQELNCPAMMYQVYLLFDPMHKYKFNFKQNSNGLDIVIYNDFSSIMYFGDIICAYLSKNFGYDCILVDSMYHSKVRFQSEYKGDKEYAKVLAAKLEDYNLIETIKLYTSGSPGSSARNNLMAVLSSYRYPFELLVHLHDLLFPNDKLPPDNYTKDEIINLIINKIDEYKMGNGYDMQFYDFSSDTSFNELLRSY